MLAENMISSLFLDCVINRTYLACLTQREGFPEKLQSILIIHPFYMWEFTYLLKLICNPQIHPQGAVCCHSSASTGPWKIWVTWCACFQPGPSKVLPPYFISHKCVLFVVCVVPYFLYSWYFCCLKWLLGISADTLSSAFLWKRLSYVVIL